MREAKKDGSFPEDAQWRAYFSDEEIGTFWWPTDEERKDWERRWFSTPVERQLDDPSLETPWDFGSMLDAIRDGDYTIIGVRTEGGIDGFLEFDPQSYPFGGTGALKALISAYGHDLIGDDDGTGFTESTKA